MVEIRRIEVDKLFGLYDHRIDLHPAEHITLLHGPNGVGKTALLRLLNSLINGNYEALSAVPFSEFRIYFTDSRWIRVKQDVQALDKTLFAGTPFGVNIDVFRGRKQIQSTSGAPLNPNVREFGLYILSKIININQIDSNQWVERNTQRSLTTEEAIRYALNSKYADELLPQSTVQELRKLFHSQPFTEILGDTKAYLIGTNRLLPPSKPSRPRANNSMTMSRSEEFAEESPESAIRHHANVIRDIIAATLAQYSSVSAQSDRTFPERLVHGRAEHTNLSDNELRDRFANLEKRRNQLEAAGLLDAQAAGRPFTVPDSLNETTLAVLSVYVEDTEQKLAVFNDIEARITLLKQIVEKRFLRTKRFAIDRKKGFSFTLAIKKSPWNSFPLVNSMN